MNPRKGTETVLVAALLSPVLVALSNMNPRKGTETIALCYCVSDNEEFLLSNMNPRKGTETIFGIKPFAVQSIVI